MSYLHIEQLYKNQTILLSDDRRWAGFKRGDDAIIKLKDGTYDESAVMRETYYECFHCGGRWDDNPKTRYELDKSSHYVATNPNALPGYVGFSWPAWCGQRLKWGGEQVMLGYLRAKQIKEKIGRNEELKQWHQKSAAKSWNPKLESIFRQRNQNSYDVALAKHDAWRLFGVIDNQKDLAQQWCVFWAAKKNGSVKQIWRGSLNGLAAVREKQLSFGLDASGKPILKDQWMFLDGRYLPEQIARHIAENKYGHWATYEGERVWMAWNLLQGSKLEYHTHEEVQDKTKKFIVGDPNSREYQVDGKYVEILIYPFSATATGQRFEASRDGTGLETLFLERQENEPPDDHELSHHSQIYSNKLVESKSFAPRDARMRYVPVPPSSPDHYFHIGRMMEAVRELWLIDGIYAAPA